jgi:hypothetical protein
MERGEHVPWLNQAFNTGPALFNAITHILGYILGDQLYYALVRGRFSREAAKKLYYEPFEEEGSALLLYLELSTRVGSIRTPQRP